MEENDKTQRKIAWSYDAGLIYAMKGTERSGYFAFSFFVSIFGISVFCGFCHDSNLVKLPLVFYPLLVLVLSIPVGLIASFFVLRKRDKKFVDFFNENDYRTAEEIEEAFKEVAERSGKEEKEKIPEGLEEWKDLTVAEIKYYTQSETEGEMRGDMSGFGFLSWGGIFEGRVSGESFPDVFDQSAIIITGREGKETLRIICPSVKMVVRAAGVYFSKLVGVGEKERRTHTAGVLKTWCGSFLLDAIKKINHLKVCDEIKVRLSGGKECFISVKGIRRKEGEILAAEIMCGDKSAGVVPIDLFYGIHKSLKGILGQAPKKSLLFLE